MVANLRTGRSILGPSEEVPDDTPEERAVSLMNRVDGFEWLRFQDEHGTWHVLRASAVSEFVIDVIPKG